MSGYVAQECVAGQTNCKCVGACGGGPLLGVWNIDVG